VRALVAAGADVSKRDAHSRDALAYASAYGECEVVRALLAAGADVNAQTTCDTPLQRAWTAWLRTRRELDDQCDEAYADGYFRRHDDVRVRVERSEWPRLLARLEATVLALSQAGAEDRNDGFVLGIFAFYGRESMVRTLLASNDYDAVSVKDALERAASRGHEVVVRTLMDARRADADADRWLQFCADGLASAAESGQIHIIRMLLDTGVLDAKAKQRALNCSVEYGHEAAVRVLLEAGADVRSNDEGFTPLMVAIVNGRESMVHVLIKAGADVNVVFPRDILVPYSRPFAVKNGAIKGQTLLMCAVNEGKESIVSALIQAGADVNARGEGAEYTALMFAVRKNHESAIRMLIEAGADVDARRNRQGTPKHWSECKDWEQSDWSQDDYWCYKPTPKGACEYGVERALTIAALNGYETTVRLLLDAGACAEPFYDDEETPWEEFMPLMAAAWRGHESIVRALLDEGAEANEDAGFMPPLIAAAFEGHDSVVALLAEYGARLDVECDSRTALMWAAAKRHASTVSALIEAGADVDHISYFGETALSLTREDDIARALRAESARRRRENAAAEDDEYVEFERSRSKKARRDHLSRAMTILDEHSHALPEGAYVDICRELQGAFAQHS